ncbi:hypothetical protein [Eubacterium barkeri]|uniref:Uncharacterized protein n=1 Tax=Eubacterium barkeri TaxID=1528 RepID=A0A1H3CFJ2_EUBBA|nr:hypothetical protein [Eubacterium barkeri]SDX52259.1 hypothetical protein SAMN04488579_10366 [Eubacterium barkeri]
MGGNSDRLGLLLIFDCVAVILTTFGTTIALSLMGSGFDTNMMIIAGFFVGIKILVMGIGDITGLARRFWAAAIFILLANGIIILVDMLMAFGVSSRLLFINTGADLVLVVVAHLLWQKFYGVPIADLKEKKAWLSGRDREAEERELDDIYSALSSDEEEPSLFDELNAAEWEDTQAVLEEEMIAEEGDSLEDLPPSAITQEIPVGVVQLEESLFDDLAVTSDTGIIDLSAVKSVDFTNSKDSEEISESPLSLEEAMDTAPETLVEEPVLEKVPMEDGQASVLFDEETNEAGDSVFFETEDVAEEPLVLESEVEMGTPVESALFDAEDVVEDVPASDAADLTELENRLGSLMTEVGTSSRDTTNLKKAVESFKVELEQIDTLSSDDEIAETGNIVRDKLQTIVNKQYLVDEVLDDLIRLSQQINSRIDDLDSMEADLAKRQADIEQRERRIATHRPMDYEDAIITVLPDEVLLDSGESEIIIDEGDLDALQKYLSMHPEI